MEIIEGRRGRRAASLLLCGALAVPSACTSSRGPAAVRPPRATAAPARQAVRGDLTGDGKADVVVAASRTPTLYVVPGGKERPAVIDWSARVPGNGDPITELASADFDGDGRTDVAIGTPQADAPGRPRSRMGIVTLLYGTAASPYLGTSRPVVLDQDHPALLHPADTRPRYGGRFGAALATGDFNGDRYPDLAVAAPSAPGPLLGREPHDPKTGRGALTVFYGGPAGLSTRGAQLLVPGERGVPAGRLGDLAAADVTGDGNDDLLIGDSATTRPGDDATERCVDPDGDEAGHPRPVGMLYVLRGSAEGLSGRDAQSISGADAGVEDGFGHYLAAARFRHGSYADVVVYGATRRGGRCDEGVLVVLRGGPGGLVPREATTVTGRRPPYSCCGGLATGDVDGDGDADLLVPAGPYDGAALAWLVPSGHGGLSDRAVPLTARSLGLPPNPVRTELALFDVDGDGRDELLAGTMYSKDGGDEIRLVSAALTSSGATGAVDLTGAAGDLAGAGPGGEFLR
ncbi:FG-GAP and VCBS repeat-containing protein [Actinomadura sp. DC4]|uniref:FG-GAP and VCBS repeat-containing protein n=1 Tax=Actinomadura sp. DC4 TaxID=3055069 RepID=UPI0025B23F80|nr:FG-GAP and VCBS repeat-containing protein [Actinomadura sp. DC4]MDN3360158.1 FG-GAP and VCBS repeat-containing protein [Actinomadura sp. DC4]